MSNFLLTFLVVSLVFLALALGVMFGRKPLAGSCGGKGDSICNCRSPCAKRKETHSITNGAA